MRFANAAVLALLATGTAQAADMIKAGKWEFSAQVQVPNMPKLPSGVRLPPGVNIGAGGINMTRTSCVDSARPVPADMHPPTQQHGKCSVGAVNKNGNTVTWETSCTQSDGSVVHSDGVAHYTGDKMEATMKTRVTGGTGGISESSQHITGRYLGPCDAK